MTQARRTLPIAVDLVLSSVIIEFLKAITCHYLQSKTFARSMMIL